MSKRTLRCSSSDCWMAEKAWRAAGPVFGSEASFFLKASSAAAFWVEKPLSTSASRRPFRTLSEFSIPKSRLFETRFCSAPRDWNSAVAPRSSERRAMVSGSATSRWYSSSATVSCRSVPPGWPETKTSSPSSGPALRQPKKSLFWSGLPSS